MHSVENASIRKEEGDALAHRQVLMEAEIAWVTPLSTFSPHQYCTNFEQQSFSQPNLMGDRLKSGSRSRNPALDPLRKTTSNNGRGALQRSTSRTRTRRPPLLKGLLGQELRRVDQRRSSSSQLFYRTTWLFSKRSCTRRIAMPTISFPQRMMNSRICSARWTLQQWRATMAEWNGIRRRMGMDLGEDMEVKMYALSARLDG